MDILEKPACPILLSPPSGGPRLPALAVTLTWKPSARATLYAVELGLRDYFPLPLVWNESTAETSITIPAGKLLPGTLYFWHVAAINAAGKVTSVQHNFTIADVAVTPPVVTPPVVTPPVITPPVVLPPVVQVDVKAEITTIKARVDANFDDLIAQLTKAGL